MSYMSNLEIPPLFPTYICCYYMIILDTNFYFCDFDLKTQFNGSVVQGFFKLSICKKSYVSNFHIVSQIFIQILDVHHASHLIYTTTYIFVKISSRQKENIASSGRMNEVQCKHGWIANTSVY